MNRVILVGRLTKEPEFKDFGNGSVSSFTVAINRNYTNNAGEREADFINCVAFNKGAEFIQKYFHKGNQIGIDGRIQTRSYVGADGVRKYVTEVVCENAHFIEAKSARTTNDNNYYQPTEQPNVRPNPYQNNNQQYQTNRAYPPTQQMNNPYDQTPKADEPAFNDIIDDYNINDDDLPF